MLLKSPHLLYLVTAALLGACASPYSAGEIGQVRVEQTPLTRPQVNLSSMDPLLKCVGDHYAHSAAYHVAIGNMVQDSSKKTGVDVAAMVNGALHKIAGRAGNKIQLPTFVMGTEGSASIAMSVSTLEQARFLAVQSAVLRRELAKADGTGKANPFGDGTSFSTVQILKPNWVGAGGITSVANGFMSKQNTGSVAGAGVEAGMSSSASVDIANIQLSLRDYATQSEFPGAAISLSVHYQQMSRSVDGGVLVEFSSNGKRYASGVRLGHSNSKAQISEDALRVGLEYGTAFLLAERIGLDISTCPIPDERAEGSLAEGERPAALNQVAQYYAQMPEAVRSLWATDRLSALGYRVKAGSAASLRESLGKFQISQGIPPSGILDVNTFTRLHQFAPLADQAPTSADWSTTTASSLRIQTPWETQEAEHGSYLSATVSPQKAGHLYCLFQDAGGPVPIYPNTRAQSGFVTGRTPVVLVQGGYTIRMNQPGIQEVWCMQTQDSVAANLPVALQPGGNGSGFATLEEARRAALAVAGNRLLAVGHTSFTLLESALQVTKTEAQPPAPVPPSAPVVNPPPTVKPQPVAHPARRATTPVPRQPALNVEQPRQRPQG